MEIDPNTYEAIDRYLSGEMDQEEVNEFQARLGTDPVLAEEVRLQEEVGKVLGDRQARELEALLAVTGKRYVSQGKEVGKPMILRPRYLVAAAVVLLATSAVILYPFILGAPTDGQLFSRYYAPYEEDVQVRGGENGDLSDRINQALLQYQAGEYDQALGSFGSILDSIPNSTQAHYYTGLCYLALGQPEQAITELQSVGESFNLYSQQAKWYMALCYLKQGDRESALPLLEELSEGRGKFARFSTDLLKAAK